LWGDVALAGVLAGGVTTELLTREPEAAALPVLCGVMGTAPLLLRRYAPLVVFVVTLAGLQLLDNLVPGFADQTAFFVLSVFASLYSVGRYARGVGAWLGAVGVLCVMSSFVYQDVGSFDPAAIAWFTALVGAPWAAGVTLRLKQDREVDMSSAAERMREEHQENLRRLVVSERATIARELHDVVAHAIAVTVLQSRGARRMLTVDDDAVRRALDAIEHTNTQALGDMRRLLAVLRDTEEQPSADPQPSLARLPALIDQVRESGLEVTVTTAGAPRDAPPGVDLSAYRVIQEALTNVIKHAQATTAEVRLTYTDKALGVMVCDNGVASTPVGAGHGLVGIRERVAVVGGEVSFGTTAAGGFQLQARLPYALEDA
jgi:signal transduction histidine kinase